MFQRVYNRNATHTFCEPVIFWRRCGLLPDHNDPWFLGRSYHAMNNAFSLVKHEDAVRIDQNLLLLPNVPAKNTPGSSPPHQDVCYFPWTYEDYKRISWYEIEWTPARLRRWQTVVSRWKGVAAICGQSMRPNIVGTVSRSIILKPDHLSRCD